MRNGTANPRTFALVGILAAILFAAIWIIAAHEDPSWTLGTNTLSDMGISDVEVTANLFNYGCVVSGLLLAVFGIGKATCETGANRTGGMLLIAAAMFFVCVGFVTKDVGNGNPHLLVAYLFFLFLVLGIVASTVGDWMEGRGLTASVSSILIVFCLGVSIGSTLAMTEAVVVACALLWTILQGAKLLMSKA